MTLSSLVCRTCLGIISENKTGYSIEDENGLVRNVQNIREMIGFCFPELNTYISVKPSICETCLHLLINSYNFKIRCMKVESVIQNYIQTNNIMEGSCVNLNNVVRLQILEALKQKNWPSDLIKEYISKVDACLAKTRPPGLNDLNNTNNNNTPAISSNTPEVCIDITDSDDEAPTISYSPPSVTQENYLSTLNLINCNTLREEVSLVQSAQEQYNSRQRTRNFVKSVGSKLRQIRMPNVSCRSVEEINANSDDPEEVLIMNFVEGENLLGNTNSHLKEAYMGDIINLENRKPMKRKLTPEETTEEILSKRRKLVVKINPNLPYLHKNKSLSVLLDRSPCYKCTFCKYSCLKIEVLDLHHNRFHKICKLCNYKCGTKPVLDKHLNQEHKDEVKSILESYNNEENFPCYICKYVAFSIDDLRDHRFRRHIKFNHLVYKCPIADCDIEYSNHYLIIRHIENTHDSAKKRECPLCNQVSGKLYDAKQHVQTHSLFSEACTFCGLPFRTSFLLKNHMEKKHSVPIREQQSGMVYDFTGDHLNLTTNKDGIVMLGQTSTQPDVICDDRAGSGIYGFKHPSLAEMLCSSSLRVAPEREDDCVMVDENNDQDCMIVESNNEPIVVDDDFSFHDWILQGHPSNTEKSDVITIEDDDDDISTVKTSDKRTEGETTNNSTEEGVNEKSATEQRGLEESLNVTVGKIAEKASRLKKQAQNNESSAELPNATSSQESPQVLKETSLKTQQNTEKTASNAETNEITNTLQEKNADDKQSDEMQKKSTTESLEVTSSQEPLQPQNLEQSMNANKENQQNMKETLEPLEEDSTSNKNDNQSQKYEDMEAENAVESRVVTSSELQEPDGLSSINVENQNMENSLDSSEDASSNKEDDNQTQKADKIQSENSEELKEVTSSQEHLQLQDPDGSSSINIEKNMEDTSVLPEKAAELKEVTSSEEHPQVQNHEELISENTEKQLNLEKTLKSLNAEDSNTNKNDQQSENSEEMQMSAVDLREVTSSQTLLQLHGPDESISDKESQLNLEETLQTLEENTAGIKKVSSSLESHPDSMELSKHTADLQKQLEEQTFSNDDILQQVEAAQTIAESLNVTSSQKLAEFSTQDLSLQAELVKTPNEQINGENPDLNSLEIIQPLETSTFSESDEDFLSQITTLTNELFNMDETGSGSDFGLTDNSCEVSSSNLLDDISQPTEEIDKFGSY